jgi:hypothetical protein
MPSCVVNVIENTDSVIEAYARSLAAIGAGVT